MVTNTPHASESECIAALRATVAALRTSVELYRAAVTRTVGLTARQPPDSDRPS